jgi:formiminoglutamate deiminase
MERALAQAATEVGIHLTLLDTAYLAGGIGLPLEPAQRRFGDGSADAWLERWHALREALAAEYPTVAVGAAIHSVRAVPAAAIREILAGLPSEVPLHLHVSEQPQENTDAMAHYGLTPIGLLAELGVLSPRVSLVHATHVSEADRAVIAASGAMVVMCPTTEADLGDGIGPAGALAGAGTPIALGSDQNAVVDPFLEMRGLEAGERLASGQRGRFDPAALLSAASTNGYASLGMDSHALAVGDPADLVEVADVSARTVGARAEQLVLAATASDVTTVIVGGRVVARDGHLVAKDGAPGPSAAELLGTALSALEADA